MGISDKIEAFILELMKHQEEETLKIQRNELAQIFGCVPSQINYVISTRFNPERGYMVSSRRGGGGFVVIKRLDNTERLKRDLSCEECLNIISSLSRRGLVTERESEIIYASLKSADILTDDVASRVRANMIDNILITIGGEKK